VGEEGARSNPCVRICRYKKDVADSQVCIGCFRDAYEIANWSKMSEEARALADLDIADRSARPCPLRSRPRCLVPQRRFRVQLSTPARGLSAAEPIARAARGGMPILDRSSKGSDRFGMKGQSEGLFRRGVLP
jgi:predicted Fe-S protein YdhL (DUF1289 family)